MTLVVSLYARDLTQLRDRISFVTFMNYDLCFFDDNPFVANFRSACRRELAHQMAARESPRATALYDQRDRDLALDELERILI